MTHRFIASEFYGDGGAADDRRLLSTGLFGAGSHGIQDVAVFETPQAAQRAAGSAPNRRDGGYLWVCPRPEFWEG